jgi:hypothetical protein
MQPIMDRAIREGAQISPTMDSNGRTANLLGETYSVVDVPVNGMLARPGTNQRASDEAFLFEISPDARAYTTEFVARMAFMSFGRYMAVLNAESYAQVALSKSL